jgi:hypothetical protein
VADRFADGHRPLQGLAEIAESLNLDPKTVRTYIEPAIAAGFTPSGVPAMSAANWAPRQRPQAVSRASSGQPAGHPVWGRTARSYPSLLARYIAEFTFISAIAGIRIDDAAGISAIVDLRNHRERSHADLSDGEAGPDGWAKVTVLADEQRNVRRLGAAPFRYPQHPRAPRRPGTARPRRPSPRGAAARSSCYPHR